MASVTVEFTSLTTSLIGDVDSAVTATSVTDLTVNTEAFFVEPAALAALTDAEAADAVTGMTQQDVFEMRKGIPTHRTRRFASTFAAAHGLDPDLVNSRIARAEAAVFSGRSQRAGATDAHRRGATHAYGNQVSPTDSFGRPSGMSLRGPRDTDLVERNHSPDPISIGAPYRQSAVNPGILAAASSVGLDISGLDLNYAYITYFILEEGSLYISTSGCDASEMCYDILLYSNPSSSLPGPYTGIRIDEFNPGAGIAEDDVSRFLLFGMVSAHAAISSTSIYGSGLTANTRAHPSTIRVFSPDSATFRYWFSRSSDIQYSYRR
jgi:hypothetical protein